jgi:hypothetical protein
MAEDWRVTGTLDGKEAALELLARLHHHEAALPGRVAVSHDEGDVFVYADARDVAEAARRELAALAPEAGWRLSRWHHEEERWEDADVPLPSTPAEHAREHARLEAEEAEESSEGGEAEWEVRVEFASHHEANAFAQKEQAEGLAVARRWRYVLIGLADEDDAHALAQRLRGRLPHDAVLHVEPGAGLAWELMPRNPFAVFGGLAG